MNITIGTRRLAVRVPLVALVGIGAAAAVVASSTPGIAATHPRAKSHETTGAAGFITDAARLFDSRYNSTGSDGPVMGFVPVTTTADVPEGAAVVLSIQALDASGPGYVTAYPDGSSPPATSNLDYTTGQTISATVIVSVPADGVVDLNLPQAATNLLVDQVGYYNSGDFVASAPARIADSRTGVGITTGAKTGSVTVPLGSSDVGDGVVALDVLTTQSTGAGYVALGGAPGTDIIDYTTGTSTANLVYAKVTDGSVTLNISGAKTQIVVDYLGYAPSGSVVTAASPAQRIADSRTPGDGFATSSLVGAETLTIPAALIPTGTTAVLLNVTAFQYKAAGYVVAYTGAKPAISELQYNGGPARSNLLTVPLTAGSTSVTLFFSAPTSAVVDFEGAVGTVASA